MSSDLSTCTTMTRRCNTCLLQFEDHSELLVHYKTELHLVNMKMQGTLPAPLTQAQLEQMKIDEEAKKAAEKPKKPGKVNKRLAKHQRNRMDAPPVEEEDVDDGFDPTQCRDIPPNECLFCGKVFETPEEALEHMTGHGFRFCYPEKISDTEGLLAHMGEKIGVGHCCINCNKMFRSLGACRDHMRCKSHCAYEFDDEVEEFYEAETGIVPAHYTVDEVDELHVNGKVFGHRKYMRYYKQRPVNMEEFKRMARLPLPGPIAPRQSVTLDRDLVARKREFYKQRYISKGVRRMVSKEYHPFADIHRGNAG